MTCGKISARLMLCAAVLISVGCVSRRGPSSQVASTRQPVKPTYSKVQLLAAARQYEKEGKTELASQYYRQVLALEPKNVEAQRGLELVQSGHLRSEAGYDEIVATGQRKSTPMPRTRQNLAKRRAELDGMTAQLVADAARSANPVNRRQAPRPTPTQQPTVIASKSRSPNQAAAPATSLAAHSAQRAAMEPLIAEAEATHLHETEKPLSSDDIAMFLDIVSKGESQSLTDSSTSAETTASTETSPEMEDAFPEIEIVSAEIPEEAEIPEATEAFDWEDDVWENGAEQEPASLVELCKDCNAAVLREVKKLESDDPLVRKDGLHNLAQMGPDAASAAESVSWLLDDVVEMVRAYAAWTMWEVSADAAAAVPTLTELLNSSDTNVVQFSAYTLSWMGEEAQAAIPALRQLLTDYDKLVRVHAAEALLQIEPPAERVHAIEALILLAGDPHAEVRSLALVALGSTPDQPTPEMAAALTNALHDRDAEVRAAAALSLGAFAEASESTIAQLEFVAVSDQEEVRQAAATALDCLHR